MEQEMLVRRINKTTVLSDEEEIQLKVEVVIAPKAVQEKPKKTLKIKQTTL